MISEASYDVHATILPRTNLVEGTPAELSCRVPGRPAGKLVKWMFEDEDRRKLILSRNCVASWGMVTRSLNIESTRCQGGEYFYINIKHVGLENQGKYSCVIGDKTSAVTLTVTGMYICNIINNLTWVRRISK